MKLNKDQRKAVVEAYEINLFDYANQLHEEDVRVLMGLESRDSYRETHEEDFDSRS